MGQFHWQAESYLELMRTEVPAYELELGTGTGETTRRLLARHPKAELLGIDSSDDMLAAARRSLDSDRVDLRIGRLEDPLPAGPFDLVVSVLTVHHLSERGSPQRRRGSRATWP